MLAYRSARRKNLRVVGSGQAWRILLGLVIPMRDLLLQNGWRMRQMDEFELI
jgi:hypothetical protein